MNKLSLILKIVEDRHHSMVTGFWILAVFQLVSLITILLILAKLAERLP